MSVAAPHVSDATALFTKFRKRDGTVVRFDAGKISRAIVAAENEVARETGVPLDPELAKNLTQRVVEYLADPLSPWCVCPDTKGERIPEIEVTQDVVEMVLSEAGRAATVVAYKRYRKARECARKRIRVRTRGNGKIDTTDASLLLVESITDNVARPWDRAKIVDHLRRMTGLDDEIAGPIAKSVENHIIMGDFQSVSTALIRELVNNELQARGYQKQLHDLSMYPVPREFVETTMYAKSTENSNIVNNNPEAVNLGIAELVLKQWALDTIFSPRVKRAHDTGMVHLHDLGYPHRVYCSSHSLEYIKKYGLVGLENLNTQSNPAKSAEVLTGHLNTFLASMQANYAGALGIGYINVFYSPYLVGRNEKQLHQIAQELVFNGSQNAFSRGGQTIFLDFNVHAGVPSYLKTVPAVGPGGRYMLKRKDGTTVPLVEETRKETTVSGQRLMDLYVREGDGRRLVLRELPDDKKGLRLDAEVEKDLSARGEGIVTYGDFEEIAQEFAIQLLRVWGEGDRHGRVFQFPKCDFHVNLETFRDARQLRVLRAACDLASRNGSTYFVFDRDEVTLSACCRLRTTVQDSWPLRHPETMRFCGFQNVTINIPQAAYRASRQGNRTIQGLLDEIDKALEVAVQAHLEKQKSVSRMLGEPGQPLWQVGKISCDGRPYIELEKCTYIVGLIGLDDALAFLLGKRMHEGDDVLRTGLEVIGHMYQRCRQYSEKHGIKFSLEETPAESAARRLAKTDLIYFEPEAKVTVKGNIADDSVYYTNSVHLAADANVSLVTRIRRQSVFHSIIESGAIIHAFVGEERPDAESIYRLVRDTFYRTQCAQLTISPEFTYCGDCHATERGLVEVCPRCGSRNVEGETRVVGYFSKIKNWNKSKRYGELRARQRGNYRVAVAGEAGA